MKYDLSEKEITTHEKNSSLQIPSYVEKTILLSLQQLSLIVAILWYDERARIVWYQQTQGITLWL